MGIQREELALEGWVGVCQVEKGIVWSPELRNNLCKDDKLLRVSGLEEWEIQCGKNWGFMDRVVREMVGNSSQIVKVIVYVKLRSLDFYFVKQDHQVG